MFKKIKKRIKKIWNYFFIPREYDPPAFEKEIKREESKPVIFAEPVTAKEKFNKSSSLTEFLNNIDKHE